MFEISQILNCSPHKVVYWMNKYTIVRRSLSDAMYSRLNPNGDPFLIKSLLSNDEMYLYGLGIGIYWGEGEKVSKNALRVANSDPFVLIVFSKFLQEICSVQKEKMRYSLICFNDSDPKEVKNYWAKMLEISEEKFGKIVVIPKQGKGTYRRKSLYGVCTLTVSNTKLKVWIMSKIADLKQSADIV